MKPKYNYNTFLENMDKSNGLIFVYSAFRSLEGIGVFALVLEANGWERFNYLEPENPEGAKNMAEGAAIDGIGNALFGQLTLTDGKTDQRNFDTYRMIRHNEAPKKIDVHFVKNEIDPTGLGEPPFPPIFGAMANALYQATGKRFYQQPFQPQLKG